MIITARMIHRMAWEESSKRPCVTQMDLFRETFPDGAELTLENCQKAARAGLNLVWFADNCLPAGSAEETAFADKESAAYRKYSDATTPLFREYMRDTRKARERFQRTTDRDNSMALVTAAAKEYNDTTDRLLKQYWKRVSSHKEEYAMVVAAALFEALQSLEVGEP